MFAKAQKVVVAVARFTLRNDLAVEHVECREQGDGRRQRATLLQLLELLQPDSYADSLSNTSWGHSV